MVIVGVLGREVPLVFKGFGGLLLNVRGGSGALLVLPLKPLYGSEWWELGECCCCWECN